MGSFEQYCCFYFEGQRDLVSRLVMGIVGPFLTYMKL